MWPQNSNSPFLHSLFFSGWDLVPSLPAEIKWPLLQSYHSKSENSSLTFRPFSCPKHKFPWQFSAFCKKFCLIKRSDNHNIFAMKFTTFFNFMIISIKKNTLRLFLIYWRNKKVSSPLYLFFQIFPSGGKPAPKLHRDGNYTYDHHLSRGYHSVVIMVIYHLFSLWSIPLTRLNIGSYSSHSHTSKLIVFGCIVSNSQSNHISVNFWHNLGLQIYLKK